MDASIGDGTCADSNGRCSLRAAVQEANAAGGADTIRLAARATYTLSIAGASEDGAATGDLDATSTITIQGRGSTVDAAGLDRAFDALAANLTVDGLTVIGGAPPETQSGGGYRSTGTLVISNSQINGNTVFGAGASGGGIINDVGTLRLSNSGLDANAATRAGGAIEANLGTTSLDRVSLSNNATGPTPGNGGGLHLTGTGSVSVTNSAVTGNTATEEGGGLWNSSTGTFSVSGTEVSGNTASGPAADQGGGGLFSDGGSLSVFDVDITGNSADGLSGSGGGILNNLGVLTVERSSIRDNDAHRAGGGIEANVGTTTVSGSNLSGNTAGPNPGNGGGLHLTGAGSVEVTGTVVARNDATDEGGGLWNSATGTMTVSRSTVVDNRADGDDADQGGGGLFNDGGSLSVSGSRLNIATGVSGSGGGILNNLGTLSVSDTVLDDNSSTRAGGGIEANGGTTDLSEVRLSSNSTGFNPGNGGGLHLTGAGTVTIDASRVTENIASSEGGGLWNSDTGTMTVTNTAIKGNAAPVGPQVFNDGGTFTIDG
ncbi:MAG: beta strand repeat-containing protein, partial [Geodermatophilaceae bacterium]